MAKLQNEMVFSLMLFFFASFLFCSILSSLFIDNFNNLLPIMLKSGGIFVQLTRLMLFAGICLSIYKTITAHNGRNRGISALMAALFIALLSISIFITPKNDDLESLLDIYSYKENYNATSNLKKLIIDSVVFVYFILFPILSYIYEKYRVRLFYKKYLYISKDFISRISPSFNVSVIFLFGYVMQNYDFSNHFSTINIIISTASILVFIRIAAGIDGNFYSIINLLIVIAGFIVAIFTSELLQKCNLYYVNLLFYAIGLMYWSLDMVREG